MKKPMRKLKKDHVSEVHQSYSESPFAHLLPLRAWNSLYKAVKSGVWYPWFFVLIEKWRKYDTWLPNACKKCNYKYICSGWCPVERWTGKDPHCNVYKEMIPKFYKLMWKEKLLQIINTQDVQSETNNKP